MERIFGYKIIQLEEVDSTNIYLQQLANNDDSFEGMVVVAKSQFGGRGQRGNMWLSESGKNLTFSLLLKPNSRIEEQFLLSQIVSLGIIDFLKKKTKIHVQIKWPNDIILNNKKIVGILIENTLKGQLIDKSIVGIGMNVNQTVFENYPNASSLKVELNQQFDVNILLSEVLACIEVRYFQFKNGKIHQLQLDYLTNLMGYQKMLRYQYEDRIVQGVVKGVSKIGKLQLEINSQLQEFDLKEIRLIY